MFTRAQIPVMLGGGADAWALNVDGSIQVKTPIANDTSVVFTVGAKLQLRIIK